MTVQNLLRSSPDSGVWVCSSRSSQCLGLTGKSVKCCLLPVMLWTEFPFMYVCSYACMFGVHLCEVRVKSRENFAIVPLTLSALSQRQSFSLVSAFQEGKAGWTVGPRHLLISPSLVLESQVPVTMEVPGLELTSSALTQLAQL